MLCISALINAAPALAQSLCPDTFSSFRGSKAPLACSCSADATQRGIAYGMDVYSDDSGICQAAVHAGAISAQGGNVTVIPVPGQTAYPGATRNGVTSANGGPMDGSFRFGIAVVGAPEPRPAPAQVTALLAPQTGSVCPDNFLSFRGTAAPLACTCSPDATQRGIAYGMDVYSDDSGVCISAVHAGVISPQGGNVTVIPIPGQRAYPGVTRNGVTSANGGPMDGSFRFAPATVPVVNNGVPAQQPIAATLQQTGQVQLYINFAFDSAQLLSEAGPVLNELLAVLRADPNLRLSLVGHTDSIGRPEYNMILSAKRAEAVKFWLIQNGVPAARLETSGRGANEPISDNATDSGRALNRRVQALRLSP